MQRWRAAHQLRRFIRGQELHLRRRWANSCLHARPCRCHALSRLGPLCDPPPLRCAVPFLSCFLWLEDLLTASLNGLPGACGRCNASGQLASDLWRIATLERPHRIVRLSTSSAHASLSKTCVRFFSVSRAGFSSIPVDLQATSSRRTSAWQSLRRAASPSWNRYASSTLGSASVSEVDKPSLASQVHLFPPARTCLCMSCVQRSKHSPKQR